MESSIVKILGDKITCRQILNVMLTLGIMINYMLCVNFAIAITAMVPESQNLQSYEWNKNEQNLILGSLFWGSMCSQLVGGRLSEIIGAKRVLGYGTLVGSILILFTPIACHSGLVPTVILRALSGIFLGPAYTCIPSMAAKWSPPTDRSKFMSVLVATSLGVAFTMLACGSLIHCLGWASSFYFSGSVGLLWCLAWSTLIFDSPSEHPRISGAEKTKIEFEIAEETVGEKPKTIPWRRLLTSPSVIAFVVTHICAVFWYSTVVYQLPTYMKEVLHYNVMYNGLFSALPHLVLYTTSITASHLADKMRKNGKYSRTTIGKALTTFGFSMGATCMALQAVLGENQLLTVINFTCTFFFVGVLSAGYLANVVDIAPNFASTISGVANTFVPLGSLLSTVIVGALTNDNHSFERWSYVFWVIVGIALIGGFTYALFGSGETQPWNSVVETSNDECEMQSLNENAKKIVHV